MDSKDENVKESFHMNMSELWNVISKGKKVTHYEVSIKHYKHIYKCL